jgi:sn-glycerol 3-phosphate transport system permease protein
MAVAVPRPGVPADIASLTPAGPFGLRNFHDAWQSGNFPLWYFNTFVVCSGILAVQLVTITAAGYAFARLTFPGRDMLFALFLLQLLLVPTLLIVPNLEIRTTRPPPGLTGSPPQRRSPRPRADKPSAGA